ncbi:MAG TPA: PQQ-binding-like beta-propeller repeat protein [Rhizomicrobium sp.]|nr:PQQ-binding-like beta-propeller repeat protein [Rhizomicrobium sp.]
MTKLLAASIFTTALLGASAVALENGPFTAEQAGGGRALFVANCASCHGARLQGAGEAPPLAGSTFMAAWGNRSTEELYNLVKASMPYGNGNSLDAATYRSIVAYVLSANGAKPGAVALTGNETVRIAAIADGKMPVIADAPAPAAGAARPATSYPPGRFGVTVAGSLKSYDPVTDSMLAHPKDADWLMYRRNYQGWSHSPLAQVTTGNVKNLQLAWSWAMNDGGASEVTPIIHDGVMFLSNVANTVQALNAATGELIWENRIGPAPTRAYGATRSLALYGDKVFVPTTDAKLYGLDAKTGKIVWQTVIEDAKEGYSNTGGAIAIKGKILVGLTYCNRYETKHCFISAYDADTGKVAWRFKTIALKGEPGGDTWNNLPDEFRQGAETWIAGTYDPDLNTTYWGTAQSKPWTRASRDSGAGATLYANSTLALDPDSGKLKWFYSHAPGENFDLDEVFERVLVDHGDSKDVLTIGKVGILWKLNRVTGKYEDSAQTLFQNVFDKIDPKTGIPTYRKDVQAAKVGDWISSCPGPAGGHDWPASSYDPRNDLMVIPLHQSCVLMRAEPMEKKIGVGGDAGSQRLFEMPGTDGNLGKLTAYNTKTMKALWSFQQKAPFLTGVLTTDGGVGFVGDFDRRFRAIETLTGKTLWQTRLPTSVQGHVVSYAVDGKQYIAVETGLGGGSPVGKPTTLMPGVHHPNNGNGIFVFALPD